MTTAIGAADVCGYVGLQQADAAPEGSAIAASTSVLPKAGNEPYALRFRRSSSSTSTLR